MKKRIIIAAIFTACLALCAAVWPQARHKGGTPRPNTNLRRNCPESRCCDKGRKEQYGNAAGGAGRETWHRPSPHTGRADICGRNDAVGD